MSTFVRIGKLTTHVIESGPQDGPALVLAHGLGTDCTLWEAVLPHLPDGLRVLRYDLRGHGRSGCPAPPYAMGALIRDAETLLDHLRVRDCVFAGLGLGGMIAQGLAVKRLDQVRALVLAGTAAKWGLARDWYRRAETAREGGMQAVADDTLQRWYGPTALREGAGDRAYAQLMQTPPEGFAGGCHAIAGTDFYTPTSGLRLPVLGLAGSEDRTTPPDLVRETVELIPGSRFELIRRAGHQMPHDQPESVAEALTRFLREIGHIESK